MLTAFLAFVRPLLYGIVILSVRQAIFATSAFIDRIVYRVEARKGRGGPLKGTVCTQYTRNKGGASKDQLLIPIFTFF